MKLLLEILLAIVLHPIAFVLCLVNILGRSDLSGVQLLVLGIIGAYLGRLLEQSRGRPIFVIERIVHGKEN